MGTPIRLRPEKEYLVRAGHPWIFSGAIAHLDAGLVPGSEVDITSAKGEFLARGYANPRCAIAVRVLTHRDEAIDAAFLRRRLESALHWRRRCVDAGTDAYRLINGEGDGLPGFVVDVYADFAVLQTLTAGAERLKPWLLEALTALLPLRGVFERSTGAVRREEGLAALDAVAWGEAPPERVEIRERGHRLLVDLRAGQKTGFFLDQRPNRALVEELARDCRVLNAFSYTGGFAVAAGAGGAREVVSVETSARALALAQENWNLNGLPAEGGRFVAEDVFTFLRQNEASYDLLVLDPPALVKHRRDVTQGGRAYKDLNLQGFRRAAPGALVFTFSCSQHVDAELFRKIVHGAAIDSGRSLQVVRSLGPGPDHPTRLAHPEGEYLHGLLLRLAD
jgi:23S rRNA (cytosine1962-C5)-methyltransferase